MSNHRRRYRLAELRRAVAEAGFEVERTAHANITFFLPVLLVRKLMRLTGIRTETENSINIPALNRVIRCDTRRRKTLAPSYEYSVWRFGIVCGAAS